jgi:hypothetical protein
LGAGSLAKDLLSYRENIVKAQSRRFSPLRHEKVIRVGRTLEILCVCGMVTGKELGKGVDSLPQEQRGSVGPARVAEGGKMMTDVEVNGG